jgi:hypothetical protein
VDAGKNTSTVIPASRKRRRKGNPVVSDECQINPVSNPKPHVSLKVTAIYT